MFASIRLGRSKFVKEHRININTMRRNYYYAHAVLHLYSKCRIYSIQYYINDTRYHMDLYGNNLCNASSS